MCYRYPIFNLGQRHDSPKQLSHIIFSSVTYKGSAIGDVFLEFMIVITDEN